MEKRMKNVFRVKTMAAILALAGCSSHAPKQATDDAHAAPTRNQPKVYSMEDVSQELQQGGVELNSTRENVQAFFKGHSEYRVCKDFDGGLIAVMRNKRADPKADDQYVVVAYRDGKVTNLDVGPPQFSAGNVASYCQ
jgi:hypothetical protein